MEPAKNGFLTKMQAQLEAVIEESKNLNEDDVAIYQAMKNLIDYKLKEGGFKHHFKEFQDMAISMAKLDFKDKMVVEDNNDIFSYIAVSMNMLSEELDHFAMPKMFMESVLQNIIQFNPDVTLLTDHKGKIEVAAVSPSSKTGLLSAELKDGNIKNLFASDIHYKVTEERLFKADEINIYNYKSELVQVNLSVVELTHDRLVNSSYLYMLKEKRD